MSLKYGDLNVNVLNILSTKDVNYVENTKYTPYFFGALNVEGGATVKRGLRIGYQEKLVPGIMIYDNENFFGYSEKYGLQLLNKASDYNELMITNDFFMEDAKNKISPAKTSFGKDLINEIKSGDDNFKSIDIDILLKDITKYSLIIPDIYSSRKFHLTLDLQLIVDDECFITDLSFVIINESNKSLSIKISKDKDTKYYFSKEFQDDIGPQMIAKIDIEMIDKKYFLISQKKYTLNL